jgi:extradiol dioxygenase family protein
MSEATLHLSLPVDDLDAARDFYEQGLGCRIGRVRDQWLDVWFFGLQLTLHLSPAEVRALPDPGSRHFGVVLDDEQEFWALVERTRSHGIEWLSEPVRHEEAELSGKVGGKLADPAGNVLEIKHYADPTDFLGQA